MTAMHRFLAALALLGLVAWISTPSHGEPTLVKPRLTSAAPVNPKQPANLTEAKSHDAELADSKFAAAPLHTYQPLQGDTLFALQIQPELPTAPPRKRDYVILISTSAAQAGAGWIGARQIAEAIVETAGDGDRIALWAVSTPEASTHLTKELVDAKADAKSAQGRLQDPRGQVLSLGHDRPQDRPRTRHPDLRRR